MKPIDATKYIRQLKYLPDITPWCGILIVILLIFMAPVYGGLHGPYVNLPEAKYTHFEPLPDSQHQQFQLKKMEKFI